MSSSLTVVYPAVSTINSIQNTTSDVPGISVVVTDKPHGYGTGMYVTIFIPYNNGTWNRINGQTFLIVFADAEDFPDLFLIELDSTNFGEWEVPPDVTVYPPPPAVPFQVSVQEAQCVPAGEIATTLQFATNVIGPNNPP